MVIKIPMFKPDRNHSERRGRCELPQMGGSETQGVSVTVHAIPPCNCGDDTPAIVQAIANAQAGDTISFNAGNFTIAQNATITLKGQILYTSTLQNNQIVTFINGGAGVSQLWAINGPATGITISNLAFSLPAAVAYTGAISIAETERRHIKYCDHKLHF